VVGKKRNTETGKSWRGVKEAGILIFKAELSCEMRCNATSTFEEMRMRGVGAGVYLVAGSSH